MEERSTKLNKPTANRVDGSPIKLKNAIFFCFMYLIKS